MLRLEPVPRFVRAYDLSDSLTEMYEIAHRMSLPRGADSRIAYIDYDAYREKLEAEDAMPRSMATAMLTLDKKGYLEYSEDSIGVVDSDQLVAFRAMEDET